VGGQCRLPGARDSCGFLVSQVGEGTPRPCGEGGFSLDVLWCELFPGAFVLGLHGV
jgi:hypothetical protein